VEAAQRQPISQPFIAMRAILDWRSNGGSEAKKCAMAMQQSMLATAIKYGIGTGKNSANAKRMFRRAIGSGNITDYGREEAMYHLAIQFIDEGRLWLAIPLGNAVRLGFDLIEHRCCFGKVIVCGRPFQ
jgi:hypothetical protein